MNVQYEQQGNYLIPCIRTKEQEEIHLGVWANRHRRYLKQYHRVRYYNLLTSERLYEYLDGVECQAENLFEQTVKSLAEQEQITEKLKAENMILWVQKM
ncbi:MAG TPA: TnpV protein, partial [Ruminococcaceae bacterium]|nr:TnpV protein [Oscillospiraceae bacterium]